MLDLGFVGWLGNVTAEPFLIAPFGASCVLLFGVPVSIRPASLADAIEAVKKAKGPNGRDIRVITTVKFNVEALE